MEDDQVREQRDDTTPARSRIEDAGPPAVSDDGPRTWVSVHRAIGGLAQAGLPGDFARTLRRDLDEHFVTEVEDPVARWEAQRTAPQQDADPREH